MPVVGRRFSWLSLSTQPLYLGVGNSLFRFAHGVVPYLPNREERRGTRSFPGPTGSLKDGGPSQ